MNATSSFSLAVGLRSSSRSLLDLRRAPGVTSSGGIAWLGIDAVRVADREQQAPLAHVADHDDRGVVRRVVRPVERDAVVGREALDVLHPADGRPAVGVARERRLVEQLVREPLDVVVDPVAPLVGDDLLLARHLRLAKDEVLHALGLELHRETHAVGREKLVVVGPVHPGRGVGLRAALLELPVEGAGACRFSVSPNIRCSKRCASPVLPGFSCREPTLNQVW